MQNAFQEHSRYADFSNVQLAHVALRRFDDQARLRGDERHRMVGDKCGIPNRSRIAIQPAGKIERQRFCAGVVGHADHLVKRSAGVPGGSRAQQRIDNPLGIGEQ